MDPEEQPQAGAPPGDEAISEPTPELRADETAALPPSLEPSTAVVDAQEDEEDFEEDWEDEEPRQSGIPIIGAILIGLVTLLIGLAAGFYVAGGVNGNALFTFAPTPTPRPTTVPQNPASQPTMDPQQVQEQMKQILTVLIGKTRHWKGDANAPVTMLEFSDFQ